MSNYNQNPETYTIVDLDKDIEVAELAVQSAQNYLIATLEQQHVKMSDISTLETTLEKLTHDRDELRGTREFLIKRQRLRADSDGGDLSFLVYLVRWGDEFRASDVGDYVLHQTTLNDAIGVTGVLYVMRGWFAGYVEGSADSVFKTFKTFKSNKGQFRSVITINRGAYQKGVSRLYPNDSLKVIHVESPESLAQKSPESCILRELASLINIHEFIPTFTLANSGLGRVDDGSRDAIKPIKTNSSSGKKSFFNNLITQTTYPSLPRYVFLVSPFGDLWDSGLTDHEIDCVIHQVYDTVEKEMSEPQTATFNTGMVGPHTTEGMYIVADSTDGSYVLTRVDELYKTLMRNLQIKTFYKPIVVLHHCDNVGLVMNGDCNIVGPSVGYTLLIANLARQEGHPVLISHKAADIGHRTGCTSIGTFLLDKSPAEVFARTTLYCTGRYGTNLVKDYEKESEQRAVEESKTRAEIDKHIEGPGPIEGSNKFEKANKQQLHLYRSVINPGDNNTTSSGLSRINGFMDDKHLRREFDKLKKSASPIAMVPTTTDRVTSTSSSKRKASDNDIIPREVFDEYYRDIDHIGPPMKARDIVDAIGGHNVDPDYITFNQFALAMYKFQRR